jgi:hypothetical protein
VHQGASALRVRRFGDWRLRVGIERRSVLVGHGVNRYLLSNFRNELAARTGRTENKSQKPVPFFKADLLALVATQSTTTSPRLPCKNTTLAHPNSQKFPEKHRFHHAQKKPRKNVSRDDR